MSTTFKSAKNAERSIQIEPLGDNVNMTIYKGPSRPNSYIGISVSAADAPTVALAILEAAGVIPAHSDSWAVGEPDNLARIAAELQHHIEVRDRVTKEAADREVLEEEAWDFYRGAQTSYGAYDAWKYMPDGIQSFWLDIARKAREVHGATK